MKLSDLLGCLGGAALLISAFITIPVLGPFLGLLTPLPFLYSSTKLGFVQGLKTSALVLLLIGLTANLAGQTYLIMFSIEFAVLGILLSDLYRRNLSYGQTLLWGTIAMLLVGFGFLYAAGLSQGLGPLEVIQRYLKAQLNGVMALYGGDAGDPEKAAEFQAYGRAVLEVILRIYPSLMIIGTGFVVWLNVTVSRPLFRFGKLRYPDFVPLHHWRAPEHLVWAVIVSGFALFLGAGAVESIAWNVLIVLMAVYLLQGVSILSFFFNKFRFPLWARVGVWLLIVLQQVFLGVLALAGLFDQWVDFRKIHKRAGR
jgi:uncharacterized protein YybS (DUF2232 family)